MKNDGGPAFPLSRSHFTSDGKMISVDWEPGMSLRNWFAGMIAASVTGKVLIDRGCGYDEIADIVYSIADAMIAKGEEEE